MSYFFKGKYFIITQKFCFFERNSYFFTRKYYDIKRKYHDIRQVSLIFSKETNKVPNGVP